MNNNAKLFDIMYNCRAMRRLKPDPVPKEVLLELIEAANQAPTGSNKQGARWILVTDTDQKKALAALNKTAVTSYIAPESTRPQVLPHQDAEKRKRMIDAVLWQAEHLHEVPVLIIACYEFEADIESESSVASAGGSIWPAVQNLLLAARALELGAAPTTLGLVDRAAVKDILNLPANMATFCLIPIGYPTGNFGPVTRLPVETTLRWDRWG
jgi:nitroreductase